MSAYQPVTVRQAYCARLVLAYCGLDWHHALRILSGFYVMSQSTASLLITFPFVAGEA